MSVCANIHATCVRMARAGLVFGVPQNAGVLLIGESGAGKSDLALRLIAHGARLVADDRTELRVIRGRLMARAPARIAGLLEVRGLGIVEMPHAATVRIVLVANLSAKPVRLPPRQYFDPPKKLDLPRSARPALIALEAFEASAPAKIAAAVGALHRGALRDTVKRN